MLCSPCPLSVAARGLRGVQAFVCTHPTCCLLLQKECRWCSSGCSSTLVLHCRAILQGKDKASKSCCFLCVPFPDVKLILVLSFFFFFPSAVPLSAQLLVSCLIVRQTHCNGFVFYRKREPKSQLPGSFPNR